jgi:hypothetical protein
MIKERFNEKTSAGFVIRSIRNHCARGLWEYLSGNEEGYPRGYRFQR